MTRGQLLDDAALLVTAAGLVVGGLVLGRTGRLVPALACLMELLTAAGLLRLAAAPTLSRALTAGAILAVRRLATLGLRGTVPSAATLRRLALLPQLLTPSGAAEAWLPGAAQPRGRGPGCAGPFGPRSSPAGPGQS